MFEHIHMKDIYFTGNPVIDSSRAHLSRLGINEDISEYSEFYESEDEKENINYHLSGTGKVLFARPVTLEGASSLLYLQSFGTLHAGSDYYTRRQNYDSYLLLYTYEGHGLLEYEGHSYELSAGSLFFIDCRRPHYYCIQQDVWSMATLHFKGMPAAYLWNTFFQDNCAAFSLHHPNHFQSLLEKVLVSSQSNSLFYELETSHDLESLLIGVINDKYEDKQEIPDYILYVRHYMENNCEQNLTLDYLSTFANVSKYHLDREFKKYTGFSVKAFLIELRLDRVKMMLSSTNLPITQISALCGFSNYSNFYKLFCQRMGISPTEFRNNI